MRGNSGASISLATLVALAGAAPAAAQTTLLAQLSRGGTDSGTCGTNPCRTLAYAVSQTAAGGRILCIDTLTTAGATITRSMTIDCSGTSSAVASAAQEVITIDDSATAAPGTANVTIRGLAIDGVGLARRGILFNSGLSLTVEDTRLTGFAGDISASGIRFAPSLAARLIVTDVSVANSGDQNGGGGIAIAPTGVGYASAVLENVTLSGNTRALSVITFNSTASSSTNIVINRSILSSNSIDGVFVGTLPGNPAIGVTITNSTAFDDKPALGVSLLDSTVNGSASAGLNVIGSNAQIRLARSTISGNSTGLQRSFGGVIATYGNNTLIGNGVNGSFNGFPTEN